MGGLIPDDASTSIDFPINVSSLSPATLNATHGVVSVCFNINHTWDSDLQISLIAPDGTSVVLVNSLGGDGDNFSNTCLSYNASTSIITGTAPFTGQWKPQGNLGYCNNGQNGNGIWKLHIFDAVAQDQGTLVDWQITFGNNAPVVAPFTSSNLPIVVINTNSQNIADQPKIIANMGIIYNGPGNINHKSDPYNNFNGKIGIEIRGSSSQMFPKKSYGFETRSVVNPNNDTNASLIEMPAESDWILSANFSDKSLLNNAIAYDLYNKFGSYAPRTRFVELFINNQYQGVYVLMEKIKRDSNRVNISKLTENDTTGVDVTGGYILKIDKTTGSGGDGFTSQFAPMSSSNGQTIFFQYSYPSSSNIIQKQKDYIHGYVDSFENALYTQSLYDTIIGWRHFAHENSFIRYLILNEISKNVDGYRLSTYLYKNKKVKNNKLHIGPPWDYDIAFNNANYCGGNVDTGWAFNFSSECGTDGFQIPFWWSKLMTDSSFINQLKCTYTNLRNTVLDTTILFHWIDSTAAYLQDAQSRNFEAWPILGTPVWPNPTPVPTSYAGEIEELKNWFRNRLAWLDNNIPGICYPSQIDDVEKSFFAVYPNPFNNSFNLQFRESGAFQIKLMTIDGRCVYLKSLNSNSSQMISIPTESFSNGIYLLAIIGKNKVYYQKLLKQ